MTLEEIIALAEANKNDFGMSPEEINRRQELIRKVGQHTPELAAQIARGPYQMNQATPQVGGTASSTEAWQRGNNNTSVADVLRGRPQGSEPRYEFPANATGSRPPSPTVMGNAASRVGAVQGPPTSAGAYPQAGPPVSDYQEYWDGVFARDPQVRNNLPGSPAPSTSGPVTQGNAPRYEFPANATGSQPPPVNINVSLGGVQQGQPSNNGGYDQSGWYTPPDQVQLTPQQEVNRQAIYAGGSPPGSAYTPSSQGGQPSGLTSGFSQYPMPQGSGQTPLPPSLGGNPSAMHNPDYPFSPSYQMPPQAQLSPNTWQPPTGGGTPPYGGAQWDPGNALQNLVGSSLAGAMGAPGGGSFPYQFPTTGPGLDYTPDMSVTGMGNIGQTPQLGGPRLSR